MAKVKVFVDLDDTLIDTSRIKKEMFDIVVRAGVDPAEVEDRYRQMKESGPFTVSGFAQMFVDLTDVGELERSIDGYFSNLGDILIQDRVDWLDNNYPASQYERVLYTFGNPDFQRKKVEGLGISDKFDEIVYVEGDKVKSLQNYISEGERFIVIDDKQEVLAGVRETYPQAETFLARKGGVPPEVYTGTEETGEGDLGRRNY